MNWILPLLSIFILASSDSPVLPVEDPNDIVIAFGSCSKGGLKKEFNNIFSQINKDSPDVWAWTGDAMYLDEGTWDAIGAYFATRFNYKWLPFDAKDGGYYEKKFNEIKNMEQYQLLRKDTSIIGIWDDHEYGGNDADNNFPYKEDVKKYYLDFLDAPADDPRRKKDRNGLYYSYYVGPEKLVKIVLIDTRYNKDSTFKLKPDMLGAEQWNWLEQEIKDPVPAYILLVSGTQYITNRLITAEWFEGSLERLYAMIRKAQRGGIVFISGDVHFAELLKSPCKGDIGYTINEITTSGLTHFDKHNDFFWRKTYNTKADRFFGFNYALLTFQRKTSGSIPDLKVEIKDDKGKVQLSRTITRKSLNYDPKNIGSC